MIRNNKNNIRENFVDTTFRMVTECKVEDTNESLALKENIFKIPGTFPNYTRHDQQVNGGPHLRLNQQINNQVLKNVVKQNYCSQNNKNTQVTQNTQEHYPNPLDNSVIELPISDMTLPKEKTVKCVSRLMFSNKKSRTRAQGCPIRGDLAIPIIKSSCSAWFQVSKCPEIDLQQGGVFAISGHHDKDMAILMKKAGKTASGGGDITNYDIKGQQIDTLKIENFP
tara:strand:+ start:1933 stop:2607 length:675 start_codon:yes stop_codon:yes gene_type:complete